MDPYLRSRAQAPKHKVQDVSSWMTGIQEVPLPMAYKLRNIEDTEAAKKRLLASSAAATSQCAQQNTLVCFGAQLLLSLSCFGGPCLGWRELAEDLARSRPWLQPRLMSRAHGLFASQSAWHTVKLHQASLLHLGIPDDAGAITQGSL